MISSNLICKKLNLGLTLNESNQNEFDSINIQIKLKFYIIQFELFAILNKSNNKKIIFIFILYINNIIYKKI